MPNSKDLSGLIGVKYGLLTITGFLGGGKLSVICDCGNQKTVLIYNLKRGATTSCGCVHKRQLGELMRSHGLTNHPLYAVWMSMKDRCLRPSCKAYYNYGGRGVKICDEWINSFQAFYDWSISHGWSKGLEIDKDIIGNGMLYSRDTCCYVTKKKNALKKRTTLFIEYDGEEKSLKEWCDFLNIPYMLAFQRIKLGWTTKRVFSESSSRKIA